MKLYWASWAFLIFLLRVQPGSKSTSVMSPAMWNCCRTWTCVKEQMLNLAHINWHVRQWAKDVWHYTKKANIKIVSYSWKWTHTFSAYSSQVGPTGTTITWRGDSHKGLERGEVITNKNQVNSSSSLSFTPSCYHQHSATAWLQSDILNQMES